MASDAQLAHDAAFLQMGVYRHYKGHHYLVIGLAHDANAEALSCSQVHPQQDMHHPDGHPQERWVVVYVPLELEGASTGPRMAVRTLADFRAAVCGFNGCPAYGRSDFKGCPDNMYLHATDRFEYLGPTWTRS